MNSTKYIKPSAESRARYHMDHVKDRLASMQRDVAKLDDAIADGRWEDAVKSLPDPKLFGRCVDQLNITLREISPDEFVAVWYDEADFDAGYCPNIVAGPLQPTAADRVYRQALDPNFKSWAVQADRDIWSVPLREAKS